MLRHVADAQGLLGRTQGVGRGTQVLLRQVAGGTLGLLVTLARSVGRNLEHMSLDQDHILGRREARQTRATSAGSGVVRGLQGCVEGKEPVPRPPRL